MCPPRSGCRSFPVFENKKEKNRLTNRRVSDMVNYTSNEPIKQLKKVRGIRNGVWEIWRIRK